MYKVNVRKNGKVVSSHYSSKRKDAIAFRDNVNSLNNGCSATLQKKQVELVFHHRSLTRGYIAKGLSYAEYYDGKFGTGIKHHIENCEVSVSKSYHYIDYYVEKEK